MHAQEDFRLAEQDFRFVTDERTVPLAAADRYDARAASGGGANTAGYYRRRGLCVRFMRNFRNLTVDAGDNPGVDGIRWFGNNSSILQNVRVVGNGRAGINGGFVGQSGPNLIQDVIVEGFETGILSQWIWGQTISRATVRNCRKHGVYVSANSVAIEQLTVANTPVAVYNDYPNDWTWWGGVVGRKRDSRGPHV